MPEVPPLPPRSLCDWKPKSALKLEEANADPEETKPELEEAKAEPEETKLEPEALAELEEAKLEPEATAEADTKAEPEAQLEPETKADPAPPASSEPSVDDAPASGLQVILESELERSAEDEAEATAHTAHTVQLPRWRVLKSGIYRALARLLW